MTSTPAMNTAALKKFATESRTQLLDQMRVRIGQVLTESRTELEHPTAVALLKKAVADRGIEAVTEEAAYTWFNRLTAARYMDVNGFSGMYRVVSSAEGSASALPEILAQARAGNFDNNVGDEARQAVSDLLAGQRQSDNPDFEAYAILLRTVFHTWHGVLPSVFPASVDWVELLIPIDMLTPSAVRAVAAEVMDTVTCTDVEVVGWLYQFYISDRKDQINDSKVKITAEEIGPVTQLFTPHWIVRYLVENSLGRLWLRSKPNSQLRSSMEYYVDPVEGQVDDGVTVTGPEEIRLIDPACGSGHMLTYAFDLLYAIYEEEGYAPSDISRLILTHNLVGTEIDTRAAQLASFALAMKARGRDRRFFTRNVQPRIVLIEAIQFTDDNIQSIVTAFENISNAGKVNGDQVELLLRAFEDANTFGALIRVDAEAVRALARTLESLGAGSDALFTSHLADPVRELLNQAHTLVDDQYHVVVANPPYLGARTMGAKLSDFAKKQYPHSKTNTCAMFIERNRDLATSGALISMVTLHSWMFLKSYAKIRTELPQWGFINSMIHLGSRGFDQIGGEVVQTTAFVIDKVLQRTRSGLYIRLVDGGSEAEKQRLLREALDETSHHLRYSATVQDFSRIPESPIVYWLSEAMKDAFDKGIQLGKVTSPRQGLATADNDRFLRQWFEVSGSLFAHGIKSRNEAELSGKKWFPYNKGGNSRKWWGNQDYVVNWEGDGKEIRSFFDINGKLRSRPQNTEYYFRTSISWSDVNTGEGAFRIYREGFIFDIKGMSTFLSNINDLPPIIGLLNTGIVSKFLKFLSPSMSTQIGDVARIPIVPADPAVVTPIVSELIEMSRQDWNAYETSWEFTVDPLVDMGEGAIEKLAKHRWSDSVQTAERAQSLEEANNRYFSELYELQDEIECEVPLSRISLTANPYYRYAPPKDASRTESEYQALFFRDVAKELISYAVGCMMGRYSLDRPGLILADAGDTLEKFNQLVPDTSFQPDDDGIIPITDGEYFTDDITARFREFLAVAFGTDAVEANIAWIEEALTIGAKKRKTIEDYFLNDFYDDHVQAYSSRPIYWQFSSPKKGFNALVYLHRYTPATIGLIHQNYAEEHLDKLQARLDTISHALPSADKSDAVHLGKERDTIAARIREIRSWVDDVLFRMSTERIALDLDDGVKANYPKLAGAVKKVARL